MIIDDNFINSCPLEPNDVCVDILRTRIENEICPVGLFLMIYIELRYSVKYTKNHMYSSVSSVWHRPWSCDLDALSETHVYSFLYKFQLPERCQTDETLEFKSFLLDFTSYLNSLFISENRNTYIGCISLRGYPYMSRLLQDEKNSWRCHQLSISAFISCDAYRCHYYPDKRDTTWAVYYR